MYSYTAASDFVLLYPVYALLFVEHGLSVAQISSLFVVWSVVGIVATVPLGALADVVSRRLLLAIAPVLTGSAFALWLLVPTYLGFAAGFILWGLAESLTSGTLEALVHSELAHTGAAARYASVMGRARAVGTAAVGTSTLAAVPVLAWGGYSAVGVASVGACALACVAAVCLPESRHAPEPCGAASDDEVSDSAALNFVTTLRAGLSEVGTDRRVRVAVGLLIVVTTFWGVLDEYVPLLVTERGVAPTTVPLVVALVWVGVTAGGLLAGAAERLPQRTFGWLLAAAGVVVGVGALLGGPIGWIMLGAGLGCCELAGVIADARLQERITGTSRATVTSVAGLGSDLATTGVYPFYAVAAGMTSHAAAFALLALPYVAVGGLLAAARRRSAD